MHALKMNHKDAPLRITRQKQKSHHVYNYTMLKTFHETIQRLTFIWNYPLNWISFRVFQVHTNGI